MFIFRRHIAFRDFKLTILKTQPNFVIYSYQQSTLFIKKVFVLTHHCYLRLSLNIAFVSLFPPALHYNTSPLSVYTKQIHHELYAWLIVNIMRKLCKLIRNNKEWGNLSIVWIKLLLCTQKAIITSAKY